jgi:hypothetical protein
MSKRTSICTSALLLLICLSTATAQDQPPLTTFFLRGTSNRISARVSAADLYLTFCEQKMEEM